jgi:hypothetical protein
MQQALLFVNKKKQKNFDPLWMWPCRRQTAALRGRFKSRSGEFYTGDTGTPERSVSPVVGRRDGF